MNQLHNILKHSRILRNIKGSSQKPILFCKYYNQDTIVHYICPVGGNTMVFNVLTQAGLPSKGSKVAGDRVKFFWEFKNGNDETCYSEKVKMRKKYHFIKNKFCNMYVRERQKGYQAWIQERKKGW